MMRLYFAYGSNMSAAVLARRLEREPASFRRRRGVLTDYKLAFNKVSSTNPIIGYANVVPARGHRVEGILNELDASALARLDAIELVPHHYTRSQVTVTDGNSGSEVPAEIYTAQPAWIRPELIPLRSYLETLLGGDDLLSVEYLAPLRVMQCSG